MFLSHTGCGVLFVFKCLVEQDVFSVSSSPSTSATQLIFRLRFQSFKIPSAVDFFPVCRSNMDNPPASVSSTLESLVNHIALPPRLPGKRENNIDHIERELIDRLLSATRILRHLTDGEISSKWEGVRHVLQNCKTANAGGKLNKTSLLAHLRSLERNECLILHVAEQNAGLLIQRRHE